jgi:quercetin dioxygenase-like cupin family protein
LVVVESGSLVLRGNGTARIVRAGEEGSHQVAKVEAEIVLREGDAVAISGNVVVLRNEETTTSVALGLALLPGDEVGQSTFLTHNGVPTKSGAVALAMLRRADGTTGDLEGLRIDALAVSPAIELPAGPAVLAVGRASLLPGSGLPAHEALGAEQFFVESGSFRLDPDVALQVARFENETSDVSGISLPITLGAGEAALIRPGPTGEMRNAGDGEVVVVVVTIRPVPSETVMADTAVA